MAISQAKKLELIMKHGKKFASKSLSTSVLGGIHYAADGAIVTTDRCKLLRIGGVHNYAQPFTSHAVTGEPIEGVYPDTSKAIPQAFKTQITLSEDVKRTDVRSAVAQVKVALDIAKLSGDKSFVASLSFVGSSKVTLGVKRPLSELTFSAGVEGSDIEGPDVTLRFNAELMLAGLNVFKDAGSKRVTLGVNGPTAPIVLRDEENEIDVIVLPYRVNG